MQTFRADAPISAVLDIPAGRVRLVAADQADITVEVLPADASKSRDVKAAEQTTVEYADGVLRVLASGKTQYFRSSGSVDVTVQLPTDSTIEGKAAAAEFRAVGRFGAVAFDGAYGTIEVDEAASVHLTALAGDVSVNRLNGPAEITTSKGDIRIAEAHRGAVVLRTQSGDVSIDAAHGVSASLDAGTTLGRIANSLKNADGAADLAIQATTAHGDIVARSL
ncbi:DUF4097 family beta strand repeat-containing protein [Kribbella monticola]|uniref:DUF4097 family beta strand repeat-containing protein n=1 Tax=Kribbella monticola TaxID=2185285 RepID=UPI000DD2D926|nr:DUF4097 family beta strand repeat-containing protein [Kribbella monticola]